MAVFGQSVREHPPSAPLVAGSSEEKQRTETKKGERNSTALDLNHTTVMAYQTLSAKNWEQCTGIQFVEQRFCRHSPDGDTSAQGRGESEGQMSGNKNCSVLECRGLVHDTLQDCLTLASVALGEEHSVTDLEHSATESEHSATESGQDERDTDQVESDINARPVEESGEQPRLRAEHQGEMMQHEILQIESRGRDVRPQLLEYVNAFSESSHHNQGGRDVRTPLTKQLRVHIPDQDGEVSPDKRSLQRWLLCCADSTWSTGVWEAGGTGEASVKWSSRPGSHVCFSSYVPLPLARSTLASSLSAPSVQGNAERERVQVRTSTSYLARPASDLPPASLQSEGSTGQEHIHVGTSTTFLARHPASGSVHRDGISSQERYNISGTPGTLLAGHRPSGVPPVSLQNDRLVHLRVTSASLYAAPGVCDAGPEPGVQKSIQTVERRNSGCGVHGYRQKSQAAASRVMQCHGQPQITCSCDAFGSGAGSSGSVHSHATQAGFPYTGGRGTLSSGGRPAVARAAREDVPRARPGDVVGDCQVKHNVLIAPMRPEDSREEESRHRAIICTPSAALPGVPFNLFPVRSTSGVASTCSPVTLERGALANGVVDVRDNVENSLPLQTAFGQLSGQQQQQHQQQQQQQQQHYGAASTASSMALQQQQQQQQHVQSQPGPYDDHRNNLSHTRRSANMTECVNVPSSEHVAEIVGRQGCKIKALRAKTNTYIKTPVRGEEPVFVVTGRREDVQAAKKEIEAAAEHFTQIRASRRGSSSGYTNGSSGGSGGGPPSPPGGPGQVTLRVPVPYRVVGLVVGPKGATIKRIQQQTHTYIVTPSRDRDPVFEITGSMPNVQAAKREIEQHIASRTGLQDTTNLPNHNLTQPQGSPGQQPPQLHHQSIMSAMNGDRFRQNGHHSDQQNGLAARFTNGSVFDHGSSSGGSRRSGQCLADEFHANGSDSVFNSISGSINGVGGGSDVLGFQSSFLFGSNGASGSQFHSGSSSSSQFHSGSSSSSQFHSGSSSSSQFHSGSSSSSQFHSGSSSSSQFGSSAGSSHFGFGAANGVSESLASMSNGFGGAAGTDSGSSAFSFSPQDQYLNGFLQHNSQLLGGYESQHNGGLAVDDFKMNLEQPPNPQSWSRPLSFGGDAGSESLQHRRSASYAGSGHCVACGGLDGHSGACSMDRSRGAGDVRSPPGLGVGQEMVNGSNTPPMNGTNSPPALLPSSNGFSPPAAAPHMDFDLTSEQQQHQTVRRIRSDPLASGLQVGLSNLTAASSSAPAANPLPFPPATSTASPVSSGHPDPSPSPPPLDLVGLSLSDELLGNGSGLTNGHESMGHVGCMGGEQRSGKCVRCQDHRELTCLVPCGHMNFCKDCADVLTTEGAGDDKPACPTCDQPFSLGVIPRKG